MQGKILKILEDGNKYTGSYKTSWDGKDENGFKSTIGVLFLQDRNKLRENSK